MSASPPLMMTIAALALALFVLGWGLCKVPEGEARLVHRFGRYHRTLMPGWHLLLPLMEKEAGRVGLFGHHVEIHLPQQSSDADIYFQVLEPAVSGPALTRLDDLVTLEATARLADLRREQGSDDSIPGLSRRFGDLLNARLGRLGLRVIRCQLHLPGL